MGINKINKNYKINNKMIKYSKILNKMLIKIFNKINNKKNKKVGMIK